MRLAIVSDTHLPRGSRALPDACVQRLRDADAVLHAGDFVELEILRDIEALGPPVHAVRGNVDSPELQALLPATRVLEFGRARIGLLHDAGAAEGRLERMRRRFPDADAVVYGHTHMPWHEEDEGFTLFNPGSPTERRRAPSHTMGVATVRGRLIGFELIVLDQAL